VSATPIPPSLSSFPRHPIVSSPPYYRNRKPAEIEDWKDKRPFYREKREEMTPTTGLEGDGGERTESINTKPPQQPTKEKEMPLKSTGIDQYREF
jgi:hypothetical protein